jgi:hypothetical protein
VSTRDTRKLNPSAPKLQIVEQPDDGEWEHKKWWQRVVQLGGLTSVSYYYYLLARNAAASRFDVGL